MPPLRPIQTGAAGTPASAVSMAEINSAEGSVPAVVKAPCLDSSKDLGYSARCEP